jgi:hypothetical protein
MACVNKERELSNWYGALPRSSGIQTMRLLRANPLYRNGLDFYVVHEVMDSSWVKQMEDQNRICFPNTERWQEHHYIFTFHDSTFECVADSLRVSFSTGPSKEVYEKIASQLR